MQAPPDNNQQGGGAPVIDGGQSPQPQPLAAAPVALPSLQAAMGAAAAGGFPITIQPAAADAGAPGAVRPAAGAGTAAPQLTPMPVLTSPTGVPLLPMLNPAAFQGLQPGFAVRPGMQPVSAGAQHVPGPPFFFPAVPLQQPAVAAAAPAAAAQVAVVAPSPARRPSGSRRDRSAAASSAAKKHCNCKNSRCLKLYCECFASGRYCDGCNCVNCCNNHEHESTRQAAVEAILERNPNAFRPKIAAGSASARHNKGCNCKKSGCLKKYCECFQAGIFCSDNCKCLDCKNFEGSAARSALGPVAADASRAAAEGASPGQRRGGITTRAAANASPSRQGTASAQAPLVQLPAPAAVTQQQKQAAAKEAMREVIKPEVIEKLCMLLMVVSQEEAERWKGGGGDVAGGGMDQAPQPAEQPLQQQQQQNAQQPSNGDLQTGDPMDVDSQQAQRQQQALTPEVAAAAAAPATEAAGLAPPAAPAEAAPGAPSAMAVDDGDEGSPGASQPAGGSTLSLEQQQQLEAAQEQLVLEEFRNALQMIGRVVGDKAVKKLQVTKAAASAQQQLLAMAAIQQQLAQQQQQQQPSARAASGISGGASGAASGATPPVAAGAPAAQPQLFLLPQQLVAQQLALGGGMGGMFLQQTPQGLVLRQVDPAAAQQQQQQPAASAQASVWSGATTGADGGAGPAATNTTSK